MKKYAWLVVFAMVLFAVPAFAANPFVDVPMNHWAYDAVSSLAAKGIIQGYPDGTFMGQKPLTRYEFAVALAKALAHVDMTKASKEDVATLKKLIVEFKDELDALGVKVEDIDARLGVLEEKLGGWKLNGQFRYDAEWYGGDQKDIARAGDVSDWGISRYRLIIQKEIDDKVSFYGRLDGQVATWGKYYLTVKLPWDFTMKVGDFCMDWEGNDGLYADNDAIWTDWDVNGFHFYKPFEMGEVKFFASHFDDVTSYKVFPAVPVGAPGVVDEDIYGAKVNFNFGDKFRLGLWAIKTVGNAENSGANAPDPSVMGVDFTVNFADGVKFYGIYGKEDLDVDLNGDGDSETPSVWKIGATVDQSVLGWTSVWMEYFVADEYADWANNAIQGAFPVMWKPGANEKMKVFGVGLNQKWSDQWRTGLAFRSGKLDVDNTNNDPKGSEVEFYVRYYYTPNLYFQVNYNSVDYNADAEALGNLDGSRVRFRVFVSF